MCESLIKNLTYLLKIIQKLIFTKKIKSDSEKFLKSWNFRVKKEISLIETLLKK